MKISKFVKPVLVSAIALALIVGFMIFMAKESKPVVKTQIAKKAQKSNKG